MKKEKIQEKKAMLNCSSITHSSVSSSSQDLSSWSDVGHLTTVSDNDGNLMHRESEYSYPGEHRFDSLMKEEEHIRNMKIMKQTALDSKHADFTDTADSFVECKRTLNLPPNIDRLDRITISSQFDNMRRRENAALRAARLYRDQCTELKQRVRELETEKEGVRYFWRNQVLEGQQRGGKMIKLSIAKSA